MKPYLCPSAVGRNLELDLALDQDGLQEAEQVLRCHICRFSKLDHRCLGLVAIVQAPRHCVHAGLALLLLEWVVWLCDIQTTKDEPRLNLQALECVQVLLDILLHTKWQATERGHKWLSCAGMAKDAVLQVVRSFDGHTAAAQLLELTKLADAGVPCFEVADHRGRRVRGAVCLGWSDDVWVVIDVASADVRTQAGRSA